MRRAFIFFMALVGLASFSKAGAQLKGFGIGPYAEMAFPLAHFSDSHKKGIGGGLGADVKIPLSRFGLTGALGYLRFPAADTGEATSLHVFPVRVGIKYRLSVLYLKLESGIARWVRSENTPLIISPGVGVRVLGLDAQLKYEVWTTEKPRSFAGVRVGLNL